jgi:ribonuclease G
VAQDKDVQILKQDLDYLMRRWKQIGDKAKKLKAPALVFKDLGITSSVIRDLFSPDIDRLLVDSRRLHTQIKKYLKGVAPSLLPKLEFHSEKKPIFNNSQIESDISKSLSRKIWLKSGGHIIFDQTEAMMVVDVNTGRSVSEKDQEKNALRTDLEAAREIARQLRLRDIGGIIVIDFIDLVEDKNRKKVVSELTKELKKDRSAFDILPMSDFGLVQLTRARERPSLLYQYSEPCPRCAGLGRVPSKSAVMTQIEREILMLQAKSNVRRLILTVQPDIAQYLKERFKKRLRELMKKFMVVIKVIVDDDLKDTPFKIQTLRQHKHEKSKDRA